MGAPAGATEYSQEVYVRAGATRELSRRFRTWIADAPQQDIGAALQSFFLEADHGSWDSVPFRDLRAIFRLQADIERYIDAASSFGGIKSEVPTEQQPGSVEAALEYLIESFDIPHNFRPQVYGAIECILSNNGA